MQDNPHLTPAARQSLEVALVVPAGTVPHGEIGVKTLEGGIYAIARVYVPIEEYAAQWDALVGEWLPGSGYSAAGSFGNPGAGAAPIGSDGRWTFRAAPTRG